MILKNKFIFWFLKLLGYEVIAITIYPFIILNFDEIPKHDLVRIINHEKIHLAQFKELWIIGFYFLYVFYWLKNIVALRNTKDIPEDAAYFLIPFEIEAFLNEDNKEYLSKRKKNEWSRYIKKTSEIKQTYLETDQKNNIS